MTTISAKIQAEVRKLARAGLSQSAIHRRLHAGGVSISRTTVLRILNPAARARHREACRAANRRDQGGGLDDRYL